MAVQIGPIFPHRLNPDGSFDSICPKCFVTVSTKRSETQLADDEIAHDCFSEHGSGLVFRSFSLDHIAECPSVFNGVRATDSNPKE